MPTTSVPGVAMRVGDLSLRPAGLEIAAFAADLFTALHPDDAQDPTLMRHWWESQDPAWTWERFLVERAGSAIGYAHHRHAPWERMPERFGGVQADLLPEARTPERLDALFAAMEERSHAAGARRFVAWAWEHDAPRLQVLAGRGYGEERRERFWELDLVRNRERLLEMAERSRERMRAEGIEIATLDRIDDAEKLRKIWRMSEEASQDVPTTVPHIGKPFETFTRWFESPGLRADRIWIARLGRDIVGISMLSYPPVRGVVMTDWTGTARSVRGRGVARALKCESVLQAIGLGVDRVRTDNDGQNAPILHLNETMGYVRRADMVQLMKDAAR